MYLGIITLNFKKVLNKRTLNLDNISFCPVHQRLFSLLLSKNVQIKMHRTVMLPVLSYGCEHGARCEIPYIGLYLQNFSSKRSQKAERAHL
jgi:hypothetical protein